MALLASYHCQNGAQHTLVGRAFHGSKRRPKLTQDHDELRSEKTPATISLACKNIHEYTTLILCNLHHQWLVASLGGLDASVASLCSLLSLHFYLFPYFSNACMQIGRWISKTPVTQKTKCSAFSTHTINKLNLATKSNDVRIHKTPAKCATDYLELEIISATTKRMTQKE